jgi:hypothetical protein
VATSCAGPTDNAARAVAALSQYPGVRILDPSHINEVFAALPPPLVEMRQSYGFTLRPWKEKRAAMLFVSMSYCETEEQLDLLERTCRTGGEALHSVRFDEGGDAEMPADIAAPDRALVKVLCCRAISKRNRRIWREAPSSPPAQVVAVSAEQSFGSAV